ncbi:MAG: PQQ-dependent sugar dehydrogenase [Bryobacter sp.]|nr:PQQ-dependent sugar dehydrogenase [Bryobacter sp.]
MRFLLFLLLCASALYPQAAGRRAFRIEELRVPYGYTVSLHASVPGTPRLMTVGPNGVLYVAVRGGGRVVAVPEANRVVTVASGLNGPHDLRFHEGSLYVAVNDGVMRFRDAVTSDLVIRSRAERVVTFPAGGQHSTRSLIFTPEGTLLFANGSTCNFCNEADSRRATVLEYNADGSGERLFARGLRNTIGLAYHPVTGELWAGDHGGDGLGDDDPPEEVNVLTSGADYGWPDCVAQRRAVSWGPQARPGRCADTSAPELEMQAHSSPIGLSFYTGNAFPVPFRNDALLAFRGSWNRSVPTGYKIVRILASSGRAEGIEDFLWGFLDLNSRTASGRPVHAVTGSDGAVYVSDDTANNIYRVAYVGPRISEKGIRLWGEVGNWGRIYELYGARLAPDPARLRISVGGFAAEVLFASDTQVNFVVPFGTPGDAEVEIENGTGMDRIPLPAN